MIFFTFLQNKSVIKRWNLLLFPLLLSSCFEQKNESASTLNASIGKAPESLDWHLSTEYNSGIVNINTMEGLFTYNLKSKEIELIPQLVDKYESTKNGQEWSLCIKKKKFWSDGVELKIDHFLDSWERLLDPKTASPHAHRLFIIKNSELFYNGQLKFQEVGLKKTNDYCLTIQLKFPDSELPHILAAPFTFPIRKELISKHPHNWTTPEHWIGLGPYIYDKQASNNEQLILIPNPQYQANLKTITNIKLHWIDSEKTTLHLFKTKQLDFIKTPQVISEKDWKTSLVSVPSFGIEFLAFNMKKNIPRDLRQIIQSNIQKSTLNSPAFNSKTPIKTLIPWQHFNTSSVLLYKPKNIKLKSKTKPLILFSNYSLNNKTLLERIAYLLKKNLNIDCEINLEDTTSYFNHLLTSQDFDIYRLSYTPAVITAKSYLQLFNPNAKINFTGYKSSSLKSLFKELEHKMEKKEKLNLYKKIESHILEKAVLIPLYQLSESYLVNKEKLTLSPHPTGRIDFKSLKIN